MSIGRDGVALARVRREHGVPRLDLCVHQRLERAEDAARALAALTRSHQLRRLPATLVLDPGEFKLLLVEAPEVAPTELKAAVRWRIRDMLDFHVDDAVVDVFDIPGQRGRARMMYVVAARMATIQRRIDLLENAGLTLQAIDIPELAQRNVAALLPEDADGVAMLGLGARTGLITLTQGGTLCLARILDAGLEQLAAAESAPLEMAARAGGLALDAVLEPEGAPSAANPSQDGMVLEVQRSLDYYESHFARRPIGHVAVAGGAAAAGVVDRLASRLGVKVRALHLARILAGAEDYPPPDSDRSLPAIGAALRTEETVL